MAVLIMTRLFGNKLRINSLNKILQDNSKKALCCILMNVRSVTIATSNRLSTVNSFRGSETTNLSVESYGEPVLSESTHNIIKTKFLSDYLTASDQETERVLFDNMTIHENFLTEDEEQSILDEIEPYIQRLHYEYDHWDDAIHGYRETERKHWREQNKRILQRMKDAAFPAGSSLLPHVHILDIEKKGYIKAHIDAVRFCGNIIAGLCLLSPCVMRLVNDKHKEKYGDILLNRRSLYIMRDAARYDFTHQVLKESDSVFRCEVVPRDRRISVICRNEPDQEHMK